MIESERAPAAVQLVNEFKSFLLRGNIVDLAVGVIAGLVFNALVQSLVNDVLMQIVAAIFGQRDFSGLSWMINNSEIRYGAFLNQVINFLLTMAAVFFFVVKPINHMTTRLTEPKEDGSDTPSQRECTECLAEVPAAAKRCQFCASPLVPVTAV